MLRLTMVSLISHLQSQSHIGATLNIVNSPIALTAWSAGVASAITILLVPKVREMGVRLGVTDQPNDRKQHKAPMVRLGGIAMLIGCLIGCCFTWILGGFSSLEPDVTRLILIILSSSFFFFLIGLADDFLSLSPWIRLALQVTGALIVWWEGIRIEAIDLSWIGEHGGIFILPTLISVIATIVWLVGVTNAINWMDGLDGLAASLSGVSALGLMAVGFNQGQLGSVFLSASLAGCCIGFLRHNLYPSRILMGDGGSYFLGFNLAAISLVACSYEMLPETTSLYVTKIHLPILILFLPLVDMAAVILTRIRSRQSPFFPDRRHLHHRLLRRGFSHRDVVSLIFTSNLWFVLLGLFFSNSEVNLPLLILTSITLSVTLINSRYHLFRKKH